MSATTCASLSSGNMAPHELEGLFDMELSSLKGGPRASVPRGRPVVADALPGFGIVAAVLGIVITMALLGEGSQAEIGHHVAAALVGTFLGILAAYGFVGPLAVRWSTMPGRVEHVSKRSRPAWSLPLPACRLRWPSSSAARCCCPPIGRPSPSSEQAVRGR
ncbi:MotA/TolQ/ExbB proton channel family protein [Klebsiella pneumoniae]